MADDVAAAELTGGAAQVDGDSAVNGRMLVIGAVIVLALTGLVGWVGLRAHQAHQAQERRALFLQAAREGALNLTTMDFREADADVQRILNGATGSLYDSFAKRSQPFVEVLMRTQSKSVGTITEAGVESQSGDRAEVLVTVIVHTSNAVAAQPEPHAWRMRLSLQKVGGVPKVSNVEFVP
ncbi:Mce associated membrane protein [Mycobacterium saskatchewanense]|uniref:Mammalian cell entry protein n=1 Tax=Mycobacterium saskatchewanense TaxID=220927 RepID=A0AAJ3NSC7_9MYCO|nr:mammalian cell entry protein [Mycobacterium saskatchewanense]ORW72605.1 mammalian cell entry protein [Mycobacterium saskatchewanense]BBX66050.1 Mce associated membrane protein [Mycobacterium saskatchewanense]